jgi:hypothetical protein
MCQPSHAGHPSRLRFATRLNRPAGERTFESSSDTASSEGLSTAIEQPGSCGWLVDNGFGDLCAT